MRASPIRTQRRHRPRWQALAAVLAAAYCGGAIAAADPAAPDGAAALPDAQALEADGAVIGRIVLRRDNVFDLSLEAENNWLYRLANRWHILTREGVVRQQLLFDTGDPYSARLVNESERLLRRNNYLYDARVRPLKVSDNVVDLEVWTRDLWTLMPGFSVSRSGGENRVRFSLSEQNLLGHGTRVKAAYTEDVDRESTSVEYSDNNLGDSWVSLLLRASENSDGEHHQLELVRPFYALDTRRAAGLTYLNDDAETRFYALGEEVAEYRRDRQLASVFGGWSSGLDDGWVRRYTAGFVFDVRRFTPTAEQALPQLLPADRRLLYPTIGFELFEDRFETTSNRDQIDRTEDFYLGTRFSAQLGYASESAGSDRDAVVYEMAASQSFGDIDRTALFIDSRFSGRIEHGDAVNTLLHVNGRYYRQQSSKRLFFMTLGASWGEELDLDNPLQLGGDNGLRGYPLRYQVGDRSVLMTVEQRYFTDWYPFRLVRVGGAIFADIGRTWGNNPAGGPPLGWLKDVGIGLRLGPTRASGRDVIHVDLAFPLDGDPSIDDVQLLVESKRSF